MWDSDQFKAHLASSGKGDVWEKIIYPKMMEIAVQVSKCCQQEVHQRKNTFEIFGADFVLDEDFTPWVIEVYGARFSTRIYTRGYNWFPRLLA
jgi:tubulin monoglycylase TTLL3/8